MVEMTPGRREEMAERIRGDLAIDNLWALGAIASADSPLIRNLASPVMMMKPAHQVRLSRDYLIQCRCRKAKTAERLLCQADEERLPHFRERPKVDGSHHILWECSDDRVPGIQHPKTAWTFARRQPG